MNPPNYVGARVDDVRLGVPLWSPILVRCPQDTREGCPIGINLRKGKAENRTPEVIDL